MSARPFEAEADGLRIWVRLTPRAGRDSLEGIETRADGRAVVKARVRAAPEKGAANAALRRLVAETLRVPKSAVSVTAGATSRVKTLDVVGDPKRLSEAMEAMLRV